MDINLPGMNGVECVRKLKQLLPGHPDRHADRIRRHRQHFNALKAGATGYLLKRTTQAELLEAIREVHRGGSPMTTHIARKVVQALQHVPRRRPANRQPLRRANRKCSIPAKGFLYKEIAEKLGISYETVHTYIRRIYEKLQVRTAPKPSRSSSGINPCQNARSVIPATGAPKPHKYFTIC